ncbi:hypothetical protein Phum_PHUM462250 [Pediculus humanus corporis]|uniref:Uncharacterized protein n=1 Tax=Pediculus humanus subsp. corporis TaxID=121224 RepID=E0VVE1_PEDHC|nr:uncharacterized protein Phum_PHUM462250 [Pediculus humanus corporis]EEB17347.1 hypothetical protein Phum_PHUM462250 [Pediculus humanus corporis]
MAAMKIPLTPRPILNINISGGNISPNGNRSNTTLEQVSLLSFIMLFAGLIGGIYWWKRKYFSKCPVKVKGQRKTENDVRIIFFYIPLFSGNDKQQTNR